MLAHRAKRRGPRTTVGTGVQYCPPVTFSTGWAARGAFEDVSFDLSPGEIVGMAGLVGAGRSDVALAIYGAVPADSGQIEFCGTAIDVADIAGAIRSGMALVAENRREHGLVLGCSILENMSLPFLRRFQGALGLDLKRERREVDAACRQTAVKHGGLSLDIDSLSGGNQQKVLFARAAMGAPRLLIADEPTRGVNVGAKRGICDLIARMVAEGQAVLLISSEIAEIPGLCHRALMMARGRIVAEFSRGEMTKDALMKAAFSGV